MNRVPISEYFHVEDEVIEQHAFPEKNPADIVRGEKVTIRSKAPVVLDNLPKSDVQNRDSLSSDLVPPSTRLEERETWKLTDFYIYRYKIATLDCHTWTSFRLVTFVQNVLTSFNGSDLAAIQLHIGKKPVAWISGQEGKFNFFKTPKEFVFASVLLEDIEVVVFSRVSIPKQKRPLLELNGNYYVSLGKLHPGKKKRPNQHVRSLSCIQLQEMVHQICPCWEYVEDGIRTQVEYFDGRTNLITIAYGHTKLSENYDYQWLETEEEAEDRPSWLWGWLPSFT